MSLSDSVLRSVESTKKKTKDLFTDVIVSTSRNPVYDPDTGSVSASSANKTVSLVIDKWEYGEIDGQSVRSEDLKAFTFDVSTDIDESDKVLLGGVYYVVVKIRPIMVGGQMAARYLHLRK